MSASLGYLLGESDMHTALGAGESMKFEGVQSRLVYLALFPLFLVTEGGRRLSGHLRHDEDDDETPPVRGAWFADVRRQTSIATSYALMARSMLQSSERRRRPERLS
jgi:hypothetical protein